jgi:lipopolysaccharide transport system ATP-binding protein
MASPHEIALQVRNVGICYKQKTGFLRSTDFWAIKDITFDIKHGETLGVIGRNGVGKSTLLKVMTGIIEPDRGSVDTLGNSVSLLGLLVGFNHNLSGRDNAVMNAMLQGVSRKNIEDKLDEVEGFAELKGFFDQPVRTYSAGMRTRLRFAIAIQVNPDILLIDEVLGVGDASFSKKSGKVIRDRIQTNQTVMVVSHHLDTLRELCDRIVWLDAGETKIIGPAAEVLDSYKKALQI